MNLGSFVRFFDAYLKNAGINDIQTMAIMREPVDWLGSWYRYRHRDAMAGKRNSTRDVSFDTFVTHYCQTENRPAYANIGAQAHFLSGADTGVSVDHLFRYENMPDVIDFLQAKVGKPLKLRNRNVSPKMELDLSTKTRSLLEQTSAADFEIYAQIQ